MTDETPEITPEEVEKMQAIEELVKSGDVVEVPPQIAFGVSIFAMTDGGPPIVHVTEGELDPEVPLPLDSLRALLQSANESLMFQQFRETLADEANQARKKMAQQMQQLGNGQG